MQYILISISEAELKNIISETIREELSNQQSLKEDKEEQYFTRKETAQRLHISLPTLNEYTKQGIIKGSRIGARLLYAKSAIREALSSREMGSKKRKNK